MKIKKGLLIVLEGVDGAGTTTQAALLQSKLESEKKIVHKTAQPSSLECGLLIRQILQGKTANVDGISPSGESMALLFAADRQLQQELEIIPALNQGKIVICDRYTYSSIIYQSRQIDEDKAWDWIEEINKNIVKPDVVFYLSISADDAADRRDARAEEEEIFDKLEFQKKLVNRYETMVNDFKDHNIVKLDATQTADEISEQAYNSVKQLIDKME